MKQDYNNEIDLLLRSLARGRHGDTSLDIDTMPGREVEGRSDHLDADELSSFAEGVAPAPARARYIAHLADCGSCRAIVINLTNAAGMAAGSGAHDQQTEPGFWGKMASLFSPALLRFAVPAIAFTAIITISFLALRQQRRPDMVAQNQQIQSPASLPVNQPLAESATPQTKTEAPAGFPGVIEPRTVLDSSRDKKSAAGTIGNEDRGRAQTTDLDAPTVSSLKDAAPSKQGYVGGVSRPVFAPESPAAAAPPPPATKAAVNGADKVDSFQKEEVARREAQNLPQEAEKRQPRDEDARHGPSRNNNATLSATRRGDGVMTAGAEPKAKGGKDADDEGETRTVAGKRFRRQGNVWIDSAYDSSRGTIKVSRGSEQFRALVADEPGIATIAGKLDGVVILVWNGRTYRIQ